MPVSQALEHHLGLVADPTKVLPLTLGKHKSAPGNFIPKSDAQTAPALAFEGADPSKSYLAVCLDPDAPFRSFAFLGPILHWIQPDLKITATGSQALETASPAMVKYVPPGPPPSSGPHRYVFLLYEQPGDFDIAKHSPGGGKPRRMDRMRFDWDQWEKQAGLTEPVAVNFFTSN